MKKFLTRSLVVFGLIGIVSLTVHARTTQITKVASNSQQTFDRQSDSGKSAQKTKSYNWAAFRSGYGF